jgi:hypothetical protein
MAARIFVLAGLFLLVGCVDDLQGCKQAGGLWNGLTCSVR